MDKRKKKVMLGERMMLLAGICLCLVLISTHFTSGLYARYSTGASASDSARVIKFSQLTVTETGSFIESESGTKQFCFIPGVPLTKDVEISFGGSEAATIVFVAVRVTNWKTTANDYSFTDSQEQLSWSVASGWTFLEKDANLYVYYRKLEPNTTMENVDFIKNGEIQVSISGTTELYASYPETQITVKGYVVQANGFETVADAWNAVK